MASETLRLLVIGAHPDDADIYAGGLATKYRQLGHTVKFISVTNGAAGHHEMCGQQLIDRRRAEAKAAGDVIGAEYQVWDNPDGELTPTLKVRMQIIRLIREFGPDLLLTHRPNDYHPDHRYTSQLVQDAAYLVTVPNICPETPPLARDPVIMYLYDTFTKPSPFSPTVAVAIDDVFEEKVSMIDCHESQVYEWLPHNGHMEKEVPSAKQGRRAMLRRWLEQQAAITEKYHELLLALYGPEQTEKIQLVEVFEPCEYGTKPDEDSYNKLFPFVPRFTPCDSPRLTDTGRG